MLHKGQNIKPWNINLSTVSVHVRTTHTIYWSTNIAKKQQTVKKNNIYIYISARYLPISTMFECLDTFEM